MLPTVGVIVLNLFRYGPLHHRVVETSDLWKKRDQGFEAVNQYTWTPEVVYGSESGAAARVWVWNDPEQQGVQAP
jgi:hypothetical protein